MPLYKTETLIFLLVVVVPEIEEDGIFVAAPRPILVKPISPIFRAFCLKIQIGTGVVSFLYLRLQFLILFLKLGEPISGVAAGRTKERPPDQQEVSRHDAAV